MYAAWYEWIPADSVDFKGITFKAGDVVSMSVTATSKTAGTAMIENLTSGKTVSKSIKGTSTLCEENAEWIVEDFEEIDNEGNASLVPLSNWGTVVFSNATAGTLSGGTMGPSGATIINLVAQTGRKQLTSVSTTSNSVTVKYTGS